MAFERMWDAVPPVALTANGTQFGEVTVADTAGFYVKQVVVLKASTVPTLQLQVKWVISPTKLIVGIPDQKVGRQAYTNISAYTVALGATIEAAEQVKNNIPEKDHYSAVYASDPIVADRVVPVDQYGRHYGPNNPFPIIFDGTISIGEVGITDKDGDELAVNPDGSINVNIVPSTSGTNVVVNTYDTATAVPNGADTEIVSYTVPVGCSALLQKAVVSGENIAKYDLLINGIPESTLRTYFGGSLNATFDFTTGQDNGLLLVAGDTVSLRVIHNRPDVADFEGRIQVYQVTL